VQPHRLTKSLGAEDTFEEDLATREEMFTELEQIAEKVTARLEKNQLKGKTLTLKVKFSDFTQITRNQSFVTPIGDYLSIIAAAKDLLIRADLEDSKVRLLGISLSNFGNLLPSAKVTDPDQLELF
jgi:DNA polymerase-4